MLSSVGMEFAKFHLLLTPWADWLHDMLSVGYMNFQPKLDLQNFLDMAHMGK